MIIKLIYIPSYASPFHLPKGNMNTIHRNTQQVKYIPLSFHACICPSISDKWNYSKCLRMNRQPNISVRCHPGKVGISHKHTRNIHIAKWRHGITPRAESELPTPEGGLYLRNDGFHRPRKKKPSQIWTFIQRLLNYITCCMVHSGRKGKKKNFIFSDRKVSITR